MPGFTQGVYHGDHWGIRIYRPGPSPCLGGQAVWGFGFGGLGFWVWGSGSSEFGVGGLGVLGSGSLEFHVMQSCNNNNAQ